MLATMRFENTYLLITGYVLAIVLAKIEKILDSTYTGYKIKYFLFLFQVRHVVIFQSIWPNTSDRYRGFEKS